MKSMINFDHKHNPPLVFFLIWDFSFIQKNNQKRHKKLFVFIIQPNVNGLTRGHFSSNIPIKHMLEIRTYIGSTREFIVEKGGVFTLVLYLLSPEESYPK